MGKRKAGKRCQIFEKKSNEVKPADVTEECDDGFVRNIISIMKQLASSSPAPGVSSTMISCALEEILRHIEIRPNYPPEPFVNDH